MSNGKHVFHNNILLLGGFKKLKTAIEQKTVVYIKQNHPLFDSPVELKV